MPINCAGRIFNFIKQHRQWNKLFYPVPMLPEFSITTYNILAQNQLLKHLYLYRYTEKSDLEWAQRCSRLKQEFLQLDSDIYCFQEVHDESFSSSLLPFFYELGYESVFKLKTGDSQDGCAILFKRDRFQLQESRQLQFYQPELSPLLDRDQVALMVKLRPIGPLVVPENATHDTSLVVATTHLLFNPRRGDIKLAQLRLLLAELQRFAAINPTTTANGDPAENEAPELTSQNYHPIILAGDFNSEPISPLVQFIQTSHLDLRSMRAGNISGQREGWNQGQLLEYRDLLIRNIDSNSCFTSANPEPGHNLLIKHIFNFRSVYPATDEHFQPLISMATAQDYGMVDYIFYSYQHPRLRLSAFRKALSIVDLEQIGKYLPNAVLGSDHIALSAKFYLT